MNGTKKYGWMGGGTMGPNHQSALGFTKERSRAHPPRHSVRVQDMGQASSLVVFRLRLHLSLLGLGPGLMVSSVAKVGSKGRCSERGLASLVLNVVPKKAKSQVVI